MNLALPAIVLFALLLPGFLFRSRLKRVERTSLDYSPFGRVVAEAVLWAIALHTIWLGVAYVVLYQRLDTPVLLQLLSSAPTAQAEGIRTVAARDGRIAVYFLSLLAFTVIAPAIIRETIVKRGLDRQGSRLSEIFRFNEAPWYYLLTGADFTEDKTPDLIYVTAIVDAAGTAMLYRGVLGGFYFTETGELDRLTLQNTTRRALSSDKPGDQKEGVRDTWRKNNSDRFYTIDGDLFVLRYSETITLNLEYVKLNVKGNGTAESAV